MAHLIYLSANQTAVHLRPIFVHTFEADLSEPIRQLYI